MWGEDKSFSYYGVDGRHAGEVCCACGGGSTGAEPTPDELMKWCNAKSKANCETEPICHFVTESRNDVPSVEECRYDNCFHREFVPVEDDAEARANGILPCLSVADRADPQNADCSSAKIKHSSAPEWYGTAEGVSRVCIPNWCSQWGTNGCKARSIELSGNVPFTNSLTCKIAKVEGSSNICKTGPFKTSEAVNREFLGAPEFRQGVQEEP